MGCFEDGKLAAFVAATLDPLETAQVQAHIESCARCRIIVLEQHELGAGQTISRPPTHDDTPFSEGGVPISTSREAERPKGRLMQGDQVGRYVILDSIAAGGMGEVYAAYDPQLDRKVALKLLRPEVAKGSGASEARDRLLREAQAMARLSHPNVVTVHDVGTTAHKQVFVAMEFIEGQTLREQLRGEPHPWREVVDLFVKAGRGLVAAHAAGLVHRDFKPHNVLVSREGRVCVLDFGLARPAVLQGSDSSPKLERDLPLEVSNSGPRALEANLTQAGTVMGTPGYMSPEQLKGAVTDARTDQFSFCVALYEALYGERPFKATTLRKLEREVCSGVVPDPPTETEVPAWLFELIRRGMSVKPEERFASMAALLAELSVSRRTSRRPLLLAAVGGCAVLLLGGGALLRSQRDPPCAGSEAKLAGLWDFARREQVHRAFTATGRPFAEDAFRGVDEALSRWASAWASMRREACEATLVRHEQSEEMLYLRVVCLERKLAQARALTQVLAGADPEVTANAVKAVGALEPLAGCADGTWLSSAQKPPADSATAARVEALRERLAEVKALLDAGRYQRGTELAQPLSLEARATGYRPIEAEAFLLLSRLQDRSADYKAAEQSAHAAAWAAQATGWTEAVADAWILLVYIVGAHDTRVQEAERWVGYAQAAVVALPFSPLRQAELEQALASYYNQAARYLEARRHGLAALALLEKSLGPDDPEVAEIANRLAMSTSWLGDQKEALALGRRALAIQEKHLGKEHPRVAQVLSDLASIEEEDGLFQEARAHHERSLTIREQIFGSDSMPVALSLNNLGLVYGRLGLYAEADQGFERALAIIRTRDGPTHSRVAHVSHSLGDSKLQQGKSAEALRLFRQAITIFEAAQGKEHPALAYFLTGLGEALTEVGSPREALLPLERALVMREKEQGLPIELGRTRAALAKALWRARGDLKRIDTLALAARADFKTAGPKARRESALLEEWFTALRVR